MRHRLRVLEVMVPFVAWSVPALLASFQLYIYSAYEGRDVPIWRSLARGAPSWYVWALATPFVLRLGRQVPLGRPFARGLR
jgi:hypothetical protein